jgi:H/ACA ribonucleoprotein complex subunit 4
MKLPFEKIEREVFIKLEAKTDKEYGKRPESRSITELLEKGVICLNKNSGPTSHQVSDYVKKILKISKSGHGGTLVI